MDRLPLLRSARIGAGDDGFGAVPFPWPGGLELIINAAARRQRENRLDNETRVDIAQVVVGVKKVCEIRWIEKKCDSVEDGCFADIAAAQNDVEALLWTPRERLDAAEALDCQMIDGGRAHVTSPEVVHSAESASACCSTFCTAASCRSGGYPYLRSRRFTRRRILARAESACLVLSQY